MGGDRKVILLFVGEQVALSCYNDIGLLTHLFWKLLIEEGDLKLELCG